MNSGLLIAAAVILIACVYLLNRFSQHDREVSSATNLIPESGPILSGDDAKTIDLYMREWQVVIQTQMHFNDLIIRFRSMALTAFVALAGAAVAAGNALGLAGDRLYVILALPFVFWVAALVIDLFYYHQLLLGAVAQAAKYDSAEWLKNRGFFGLTLCIREHARPSVARAMVALFYLVPLIAAAILVLWAGSP